jgi:DNA-directed RNA polymerase specialized sigma24 family protein
MEITGDNRGDWRFEPAIGTDLRKRAKPDVRDLLITRMEHVAAEEQAVIRAIYLEGMSAVELGRLKGENPRYVRRRARRIASRVLSGEFIFVLRSRELWPPTRRRIATEVFVHGRSLRETAERLRMSLHSVRRHHEIVLAMYQTLGALRTGGERCAG